MPNLPPETHRFAAYVHYDEGRSEPRIIAYSRRSSEAMPEEADLLQQHAENEDIEFALIVTRTMTENARKLPIENWNISLVGENSEAALAAIDHLKQLHPGEFEEFAKACWRSAWGHQLQQFPQSWPRR